MASSHSAVILQIKGYLFTLTASFSSTKGTYGFYNSGEIDGGIPAKKAFSVGGDLVISSLGFCYLVIILLPSSSVTASVGGEVGFTF